MSLLKIIPLVSARHGRQAPRFCGLQQAPADLCNRRDGREAESTGCKPNKRSRKRAWAKGIGRMAAALGTQYRRLIAEVCGRIAIAAGTFASFAPLWFGNGNARRP